MAVDFAVGLEVHVQPAVGHKLFCACPTAFGAAANAQTCPVCRGESGALRLNDAAVRRALQIGLLLGCEIAPESFFVCKWGENPGFPRGYQITQRERPIARAGLWRGARIQRIQLEEDAGRPIAGGYDLNRCGVALVEVVTEPDFSSAKDVRSFLEELRVLLRYNGVTQGRMEEGQLRCDVNLSLRGEDGALGPKVEMKGLASFAQAERVIEREALRRARETDVMRPGYPARFAPCALPPILLSAARVREAREALPEPYERRLARYAALGVEAAHEFARHRAAADYFDRALGHGAPPAMMGNLMRNAILPLLPGERGREAMDFSVSPEEAAAVARQVTDREISFDAAKRVLAGEKGVSAALSTPEPEALAAAVMAEDPGAVAAYRAGKERALMALVGAAMRRAPGGRAAEVREAIRRRIGENLK